ncbi:MAG: DegT/DnrJ/EryC1/StrS family aminotransferase [Candidatus Omnitrophica bacterium]|nr:DegT/DnrJ/EryC1/StrS family aminotransferase [Candidatus Omnitrophota bacterium]
MAIIRIFHSKPTIGPKDTAGIVQVLKTNHLSQGEKVLEFENKISQYCNVKGAVAVNSGTSALHLALLAMGIGRGDEVIIPSYVCSALLNPIFYAGAVPRIVDVNFEDFNISPVEAKKQITKKTKAIIVPHLFGYPADVKELLRLGVPVIEDCAQSLGARYQGKKAGSLGLLSICSFYATKVLTTGEGGMVLSNQFKLLDKIRDLREYDNISAYKVRYNYKMTDIQAMLGLSQFSQLKYFLARRKEIAQVYDSALENFQITTPHKEPDRDHIYYRYVVKIKKGRREVWQRLKNRGIESVSPVFKPLHRYFDKNKCPVSDELMKRCLSIPIYPSLTDIQIQYIINSLEK